MKVTRPVLRVAAVAVIGVAVAVSVTQVISGGRWDWWWLAAALVLAILAGVLDQLLKRSDGRDAGPRPVLWAALQDSDGKPRPLGDVTPRDLGVHPSRFGADGDCPYIPRAADALLGEALADPDQRAIIVQGPRLAGTTRTLARAARLHLPGHRAAAFTDDPQIPLTDMITQAGQWAKDSDGPGAVLWLDAITPARLTSLAHALAGELPDRLRPVGGMYVMREQLNRLIEVARRPSIVVQVIPLGVGAHQGTSGNFVIADFGDGPSVAYQDTAVQGQVVDDAGDVKSLMVMWDTLKSEALARAASLELIEEVAKTWT